MARLKPRKRAGLPDRAFAYVDSRGRRRLPIHDKAHVRNALARFNQVGFESDEARERARTRLLHAAKKYSIVPVGFITGQLESERRDATAGRLVIELGRYLVGEAGIYVCRVLDRKHSRGEVFLVTDGGLHHHLAASGNFGQVIRKNYPVVIGNRVQGREREVASVVGPLCTPLDILGARMDLARADVGDLVAVLQSGAYGLTASPTAFLGHPAPVEVLV